MGALAAIIRAAGPAVGRGRPPPSSALRDIVACRTRSRRLPLPLRPAPRCSTATTPVATATARPARRIARRTGSRGRAPITPRDHYLLTFTLPAPLRAVAQAHPELVYAALLRQAAATVQTLAADRTWVGGTPGILAVLHTWSRTLGYHPHAHLLVTTGGLAPDGTTWIRPAHPRFLCPGYMLSEVFRAKMRHALTRAGLARAVDPRVWQQRWIVHVQKMGRGEHAARYLARYVYRVALTNERLQPPADGQATLRYTHARTHETRHLTLPVAAFLTRFLQHVLPRGFAKIRAYGLLSPSRTTDLAHARRLLDLRRPAPGPRRRTPPGRRATPAPPTACSMPRSDVPRVTAAPCVLSRASHGRAPRHDARSVPPPVRPSARRLCVRLRRPPCVARARPRLGTAPQIARGAVRSEISSVL